MTLSCHFWRYKIVYYDSVERVFKYRESSFWAALFLYPCRRVAGVTSTYLLPSRIGAARCPGIMWRCCGMAKEVKITKKITIELDVITGDVTFDWEDLSIAEVLGLMEFAKMMIYNSEE